MSAYFVTSVGTGIGKTFTTCALLHAAKQQKMDAVGCKPIISGWDDSADTDTAKIISIVGGDVDGVSPWRFKAPLSPHMAAPKERKHIDVEQVIAWTNERKAKHRLSLFETVGGIMVPLDDHYTTLDWMQGANLPVILTTGSYLGSISHTLTALAVLKVVGIEVKALVMNESEEGIAFEEAVAGLKPFIKNIPLQIFQPRVSSQEQAHSIHALAMQL